MKRRAVSGRPYSEDIRYTKYADTQKILGQTYGMAVLQDFEAGADIRPR
jgi:tRNA(Met) C34 N-acetyltransferase TmcA